MAEDAAEKEASEVLHSLLSVERIEKQEIIVDGSDNQTAAFHSNPSNTDVADGDSAMQYTPVSISHSIFSAMDGAAHFSNSMDDQQVVIWESHAIVDPMDTSMTAIYTGHLQEEPEAAQSEVEVVKKQTEVKAKELPKIKINNSSNVKKKAVKKQKKKPFLPAVNDPTKLEESPAQVKERFKRGCDCQDESCFRGLNPETVFKHRHNIAELTKGEHDMYLMGVTMACLANPDTTVRHRERRRLRAQYVYQGRRVCLDAFLYLENCTHYQLKRIRKHVMTHGVAPRVHGNHGKKPHNTFSLDIYCHAREFLKQYLEQHTGERDILNTKQGIQLPWDVTRKNLHDAYKEYGQILEPGVKLMGYSTFRHFMKEQFPHVKFCKLEPKGNNQHHNNQQQQQQHVSVQHVQQPTAQIQQPQQIQTIERPREQTVQQVQKCIINNEVQQVIPLVVASSETNGNQHQQSQTFLVTPVPQLISNANIVTPQTAANHNTNTFSYQLTNTGYVINDQGNLVTTMTNGQHHAPYFSRM
ncbi:uncharacterized protein LOC109541079 [Dendroctonus ponderosae]|uniref:HTH OST-type domain-containing protein n=2 Tax=Dendroctonus ponderosae TaxID=77166 RepID=A0AAR5PWE7_DENPD|nr:uncharacterized protein LOC109541079 [Dendroctonus ponderosae]